MQLSNQAVKFLKILKLTTSDYLFPSIKGKKPLQQKQLTEQAWRLRTDGRMLDIETWSPHDLRLTVRTGVSRLGCTNEVAEAFLGIRVVELRGLMICTSMKKSVLIGWADHLDGLLVHIKS